LRDKIARQNRKCDIGLTSERVGDVVGRRNDKLATAQIVSERVDINVAPVLNLLTDAKFLCVGLWQAVNVGNCERVVGQQLDC